MLTYLEKFLFEKFRDMPAWVRVLSYLVVLFLFVYLMLVPRFVDGQLVIKDAASGGHVPYRGAQLQMQIDGRFYKFRANEEGYWSIPIVSRIPGEFQVQIYHEDVAQWFPIKFTALQLWRKAAHTIEVASEVPYFRVAAGASGKTPGGPSLAARFGSWLGALVPEARGTLILPEGSEQSLTPAERKSIADDVMSTVSAVTGRNRKEISAKSPLTGSASPSYAQKIQIIGRLEKQYGFTIPDEHWRALLTVRELIDYIEKRLVLNRRHPDIKDSARTWPAIQQSLPPDQRPVFRH